MLIFLASRNAQLFRERVKSEGFRVLGEDRSHIVNVAINGDRRVLAEFVRELRGKGVFVAGFWEDDDGEGGRIRVQVSAKHCEEDIGKAVDAFVEVGKNFGGFSR